MNKLGRLPITVFTCDGRVDQKEIDLNSKAAIRSKKALGLERAVICSPVKPSPEFLSEIEWFEIEKLSNLKQYSDWMIKNPVNYIDTDFALFTQSDGFVLNAELWDDRFMEYDYIGAPWPASWPVLYKVRVGNGGFSLRSKFMLEESSKLPITGIANQQEDYILCVIYGQYLESIGIKFAPVDLAAKFSVENYIEDFDIYATPSFGFHGKTNEITKGYIKLNE